MTPENRFSVPCALIVLVVSGSVAVARAQENSGNVVDLNNPVGIEITMSKDNYLIGDTITANELRIRNIEGQSHRDFAVAVAFFDLRGCRALKHAKLSGARST